MNKIFINMVGVLFAGSNLLCQISASTKMTGSTSTKNEIESAERGLTGLFTKAFISPNLLTSPASAEDFNGWQQGVAATQRLIAKSAPGLARFVDPLVDVNRVLNQTFMKLRDYKAKLKGAQYNVETIKGMLQPLKEAQTSFIKVKNNFAQYQKQKPSRLQKVKSFFKKDVKKDTGSSSSENLPESDFYNLVTILLTSLDVLIERMLTKDTQRL